MYSDSDDDEQFFDYNCTDFELQGIDDFVTEHPDEPAPSPARNKKTKQRNSGSEPVLIGSSITTTHVKDLYELLQSSQFSRLGLKAGFIFEETNERGFMGYSSRLRIVGSRGELVKELQPDACFPSKKHAKEAAARLGIDYVKNPTNLGARISAAQAAEPEVDGPNWVGKFQEWCQKRSIIPKYDYYSHSISQTYSCEVRLPAELVTLSEKGEKVFGNKAERHRGKKQAKTAAAKMAMEWISSQPDLETPLSPRPSAKSPAARGSVRPKPGVIDIPPKTTARKALADISQRLNLEMSFQIEPVPGGEGIYEAAVLLKRRWGSMKGARVTLGCCHGRESSKEKLAGSGGVKNWLIKVAKEVDVEIRGLG